MKTRTSFFLAILTLAVFLFSPMVNAQQNRSTLLHETNDQPYVPVSRESMKKSPAYRYSGSLFFTNQVNVDEDGNNIVGDAANEPSIAVDPTNPDRIVIGWRQFDDVNNSFRQAGYGYSEDGGETWTFPGVIDPGQFRSDPVLDFDTNGNFYYNSLGVFINIDSMWCDVYRITDGGFEWDDGVLAQGGDKQWMRIDRTDGLGSGNIYAEWNKKFTACSSGSFTRSTDEGESYEECVNVDKNPYWSTLAVGPEGELFEAGVSDDYWDGVVVDKSINARLAGSEIEWESSSWVPLDGHLSGWTEINPAGLLGQTWVDVDRSDGPGHGYVYVVAAVERISYYDPGDIMFSRSTNGGTSWEDPIRINDDLSFSNTQWMGTMSVAPDGRIDVVWLDTRLAPSGHPHYSALYYSYSVDHGETWSENEQLTDLFDPHLGYPVQQKMGDYFDMVSDEGGAHLAWAATFNGEEDVYYAHITPDVVVSTNEHKASAFSFKLRNYPNPFAKKTTLEYYLPETKNITLTLYDSFGKTIKIIKKGNQPKGTHSIKVSMIDMKAGIYYARLQSGKQIETAKMVVIK